jgi:hypothetical protein
VTQFELPVTLSRFESQECQQAGSDQSKHQYDQKHVSLDALTNILGPRRPFRMRGTFSRMTQFLGA